jgi:hypothetical protein
LRVIVMFDPGYEDRTRVGQDASAPDSRAKAGVLRADLL